MKFEFSQHIFEKSIKYEVLSKSVHWEPSCSMRTNGQTDITKLLVAFCNFAKAANKRVHIFLEYQKGIHYMGYLYVNTG